MRLDALTFRIPSESLAVVGSGIRILAQLQVERLDQPIASGMRISHEAVAQFAVPCAQRLHPDGALLRRTYRVLASETSNGTNSAKRLLVAHQRTYRTM